MAKKSLSGSVIERQNVLNNRFAVEEIQKSIDFEGVIVDGEYRFTLSQVAEFFEVDERTVRRYLRQHGEELSQNGYEVLTGKRLAEAKKVLATDTDVLTKITQLGLFNFRSFLNLAMLLTTSEAAKVVRSVILNITIDVIARSAGGDTKYINQNDESFIASLYDGLEYRRDFTDALRDCVALGNYKYPLFTNKVYVSIFKEDAAEYKEVLRLEEGNPRDTMYSEVLDLIASYESGFAEALVLRRRELGRKLNSPEANLLFEGFEKQAHWKPLVKKARYLMASRDRAFRGADHTAISEYIAPLSSEDFNKFLVKLEDRKKKGLKASKKQKQLDVAKK